MVLKGNQLHGNYDEAKILETIKEGKAGIKRKRYNLERKKTPKNPKASSAWNDSFIRNIVKPGETNGSLREDSPGKQTTAKYIMKNFLLELLRRKLKHNKRPNGNYDSRKRPDPRKPEFAEEPEDGSTEELEGYRSSKAKIVPGSTAGVKSR
jgi:hypothetical protein